MYSHVIDICVLENLAVVNVPDGLIVPDLAGQQNRSQCDPFPASRGDVDLGVF